MRMYQVHMPALLIWIKSYVRYRIRRCREEWRLAMFARPPLPPERKLAQLGHAERGTEPPHGAPLPQSGRRLPEFPTAGLEHGGRQVGVVNCRRRVGNECLLPIRHLCRNRLRTPCGPPGRQISIAHRAARGSTWCRNRATTQSFEFQPRDLLSVTKYQHAAVRRRSESSRWRHRDPSGQ
jgi:hypothetical protein